MTPSEEFAKLNNIHWHDFGETKCGEHSIQFLHCRKCNGYLPNPTFSHPEEILEVMMKREDYELFMAKLSYCFTAPNVDAMDWDGVIDVDYVLHSDKLLVAAIEWCKQHPLKEGYETLPV